MKSMKKFITRNVCLQVMDYVYHSYAKMRLYCYMIEDQVRNQVELQVKNRISEEIVKEKHE